ncbi:MAG TPA: hypothetical protein VMC41_00595, partial [Candidatus Nanoarchaeia archaeon]|nr:hypothetical protein [Candidatus Nanoarchaeia archaeon]
MIKRAFLHFGPHFEEVMSFLLFLIRGGEKYPHLANCELRFLPNPTEIPYLPEGMKFSECLFIGIGKELTRDLIAAGVPADQIIDEHKGTGRDEDSSFRKLIKLLGLGEDKYLSRWADALGLKDSGKGGDNFTVYRALSAIYSAERENCSCEEGFNWAMEIARASFADEKYFVKGERPQMAGRFFERLSCVWACLRSGALKKEQALDEFFFTGWQNCSANFPNTLRRLEKDTDESLFQIIRMAENGSQRSLSPLGLPRLLYAYYEKQGLEKTISAACLALDAEKRKQQNFLAALKIVEDAKQIPLNDGETFTLFVYSNNDQVNCAARHLYGEKIGVIYQEGNFPKRSVQIFTNGRTTISLESLYLEIMAEETRLEIARQKKPEKKWHYLTGNNDTLLNGSSSYPGVPSTLITSRWF